MPLNVLLTGVCVGVLYLSDIKPVAYNTVCGLWILLGPLQVIGVVVAFQDAHRVGSIKIKL